MQTASACMPVEIKIKCLQRAASDCSFIYWINFIESTNCCNIYVAQTFSLVFPNKCCFVWHHHIMCVHLCACLSVCSVCVWGGCCFQTSISLCCIRRATVQSCRPDTARPSAKHEICARDTCGCKRGACPPHSSTEWTHILPAVVFYC